VSEASAIVLFFYKNGLFMRKVELSIVIQVSPEKIIEAFLDEYMLHQWWGVQRSLIERRAGGIYTLAWDITSKGFGYVMTGIIMRYEPNGLLEISQLAYLNPERPLLGPMRLTIHAFKSEQGTTLNLCQEGYQEGDDWDWYYDAVKLAWPLVADTLKDFLEKDRNS
jgi:uncharacterized protein YndB with AHSA1/START domain